MRALRSPELNIHHDAPNPTPKPGEALVAPILVPLNQPTPDQPAIPGGLAVARVLEVNLTESTHAAVAAHAESILDHRVLVPNRYPCSACDRCKSGLADHCRSPAILGTPATPGSLAERLTLPALALTPIPTNLPSDHACAAPPIALALRIAQTVGLTSSGYVSVIGNSADAALIAATLATINPSARLLTTRENPKLAQWCDQQPLKHRPTADVGRWSDQRLVIDTTDGEAFTLACELTHPRETVAITSPQPAANLATAHERELNIAAVRTGSLREALTLLNQSKVDPTGLLAPPIDLEDAPDALRNLSPTTLPRPLVRIQ